MQYSRKLRSMWKNLSVIIASCILIIRVFSIGYVVGGFFLKFHEPLLHLGSINILNELRLGSLPLGSLLNALAISPIPSVFVNTITTVISFCGICKRSNGYLRASSILNIIIILYNTIFTGLWTWLIAEVNHSIQNSFYEMYYREATIPNDTTMWNSKFVPMRCCGFNGTSLDKPNTNGCAFSIGCFDYLASTITTYGSCYLAVLTANIGAGIIMVVGTEYLHRLQTIDSKTKYIPRLERGNVHIFRNGMLCQTYFILRENWSRDKLSSVFGCISTFSLILDGGIILAILAGRFSLHDITSTTEFYRINGPTGINMGYTKDALLIAYLCLLIWSVFGKMFCFYGIYFTKKNVFATYVLSDIFVLVVEFIVLVFASLIIKSVYCCDSSVCNDYLCPTTPAIPFRQLLRVVWISTGILIFHIFLKVLCIILSDRIYKSSFSMKPSPQQKIGASEEDTFGFFYAVFLSMKRHPLVAVLIGVSVLICVVNCIYFCGLLIIRYGYSSDSHITSVLHAIAIGSLNMSTVRDIAILVSLVSISVSFFLQCGKSVSVGMNKPKVTLLLLWSELPMVLLQLSAVFMNIMDVKLVYCCWIDIGCEFEYEENYFYGGSSKTYFCSNKHKVWDYARLQFWLMFGFGVLSMTLQVLSIGLGYKYFKGSEDGNLGIFKGVSELFKSIWYKATDNGYINEKDMPNYSRTFGVFCILMGFGTIIEVVFAVSLYAYYFTEGDSNDILVGLHRFTYYHYNMESLYRGVSVTVLIIIPTTTALRVAAFIWFSIRRTKFALYMIFVLIPVWMLGEIIILCYASYVLKLAYNCTDPDVFRFQVLFLKPSQSTICIGFGSTLYVQSGLIVAYMVTHIILDIALLITLDVIHPHIVKWDDRKRLTMRIWQNINRELKNHTKTQRLFIGIQIISVFLNLAFWIGIILMGVIPGYFYSESSFLDRLSNQQLVFRSSNTKTTVLGVMYSLLLVVPLDVVNHVLGTVALFKRKGDVFKAFVVCGVIFCICDIIFVIFSADILHVAQFPCKEDPYAVGEKSEKVCSELFFGSACSLMTYIVVTFIIHITALILSIKLVRGFYVQIGPDNENNHLIAMQNIQQQLVVNRHHLPLEENDIENLSYQSGSENLQMESWEENARKIEYRAEIVEKRDVLQKTKENVKEEWEESDIHNVQMLRSEGETETKRDGGDEILHTMDEDLQNKEKEHSTYNIDNTQEENETKQEFVEIGQETENMTDNGKITNRRETEL